MQQNINISYTTKELQEWVKAGLISHDLLMPEKTFSLLQFISENKEMLYKHYKDQDSTNIICFPPVEKLPETYELHIIDKKTRKKVSTLDLIADLELLDGIKLKVKAVELASWEKETDCIKRLTQEQQANLREFISKIGASRPITRKEIATFIKEIQKEKEGRKKYRQSGHLVDQKLKYIKPGTGNLVIEREETKKKIESSQLEVTVEGIRLTEPESKLEHALSKLLSDNSQNKNPSAEDYYFGNEKHSLMKYGGQPRKVPVIRFKRADLYRAYLCKNDYSGSDAKYIDNLLIQYSEKKFLIKYDHVKKVSKGLETETLTDRIEEFRALIKLLHFFPNLTDDEKREIDNGHSVLREEREEIIIAFSPIFIDQIDTKFVEFPDDTNKRLKIAAGGFNKVTPAMRRLMEWCLRDISAKREVVEINEENLISMLALEKYAKDKKIKRLHELIKKTVDAIINMRIIIRAEKVPNSKGGEKWVFTLNTKYD